jgi:hypothetical protein
VFSPQTMSILFTTSDLLVVKSTVRIFLLERHFWVAPPCYI